MAFQPDSTRKNAGFLRRKKKSRIGATPSSTIHGAPDHPSMCYPYHWIALCLIRLLIVACFWKVPWHMPINILIRSPFEKLFVWLNPRNLATQRHKIQSCLAKGPGFLWRHDTVPARPRLLGMSGWSKMKLEKSLIKNEHSQHFGDQDAVGLYVVGYNTFRVYMLLHLMQEEPRHLLDFYVVTLTWCKKGCDTWSGLFQYNKYPS
jgi:hypothetical protein